jgi:hypothetical protein
MKKRATGLEGMNLQSRPYRKKFVMQEKYVLIYGPLNGHIDQGRSRCNYEESYERAVSRGGPLVPPVVMWGEAVLGRI